MSSSSSSSGGIPRTHGAFGGDLKPREEVDETQDREDENGGGGAGYDDEESFEKVDEDNQKLISPQQSKSLPQEQHSTSPLGAFSASRASDEECCDVEVADSGSVDSVDDDDDTLPM